MFNRAALAQIIATVALLTPLGSAAKPTKPTDIGEAPAVSPLDAPLPLAADRIRTGHDDHPARTMGRIDFELICLPANGKARYRVVSVLSRIRAFLGIAAPTLYSSADCLLV